ncbi:MAG: MobF family relaxase [Lapillicoccus sp.]
MYRGSPAAARSYVEAGRGRADDYYLAEGTGVAARYTATPEGGVRPAGPLTGDAYEAWVAGYDPDTGAAKGRLRGDGQAVRFVEVVINGPNSWSLAAALHPDIAAAYDTAQDRAAREVIGWLAGHATTRVGPRGAQVQVPVQQVEAVVVRHYTSRAGDPHRHLHLQVNARVLAEGTWRGLHTIGVRDSLTAVNGIGHAAVMCDPGFRAALTGRGFTLNPDGEIVELAGFVGPFSARAAQIGRNIDRYEATWRAAHPGTEPGPKLRRVWDARAWADDRPDKVTPTDGADLTRRWVQELTDLGYREPHPPVTPAPSPAAVAQPVRVGNLDRDAAADLVVTRLGAARSGWNAADVRGQVEQLIAATGIVTGAPARSELAEDVTARALTRCVPLLGRRGVPEHIRALTSALVLSVEADLTTRFIDRATQQAPDLTGNLAPTDTAATVPAGANPGGDVVVTGRAGQGEQGGDVNPGWEAGPGLDAGQRQVVTALAGGHRLLVVEGAAGAGKTTTLAATRTALEGQGERLVVVTPTLQAATVAAQQVGAPAFSAAWLAHQHGHRWDDDGRWTRLAVGDPDPTTGRTYPGPQPRAVLGAGDLLLVDEAGMLDQDTARALMVIADTAHARVALVGDRHQLPAVGRGGVLDLAARFAHPTACHTLDTVHRFPDPAYAQLTLTMRTGTPHDAGQVFDALLNQGQIRTYPSPAERTHALATIVATAATEAVMRSQRDDRRGGGVLVVADTREQVTQLNAAIRERLVADGHVDDTHTITTWAGERIGVGDQITTRRNDRDTDVANRDTWTVTGLPGDGRVIVAGSRGERVLPAAYVRDHVELGYASTVYGAQGITTGAAHLVVGEHTGAAGAYVAMTRGRHANTAHLLVDTVQEAREQWVEVFTRDRTDLGPAHAARLAAREANEYAPQRPEAAALADLHRSWTAEADLSERLAASRHLREQLVEVVAIRAGADPQLARLDQAAQSAWVAAEDARTRADRSHTSITTDARRIGEALRGRWDTDYPAASAAADRIRAGRGRFRRHRAGLRQARAHLQDWALTWRPVLPHLPTDVDDLATVMPHTGTSALHRAITRHAQHIAEDTHPDHQQLVAAAEHATAAAQQAAQACNTAAGTLTRRLAGFGDLAYTRDPTALLVETENTVTDLSTDFTRARQQVHALRQEPAIRTFTPERLHTEHDTWQAQRTDTQEAQRDAAAPSGSAAATPRRTRPEHRVPPTVDHVPGQGIRR